MFRWDKIGTRLFNHHISKECDKKMLCSNSSTHINSYNGASSALNEIKQYRYPVYRVTKNCCFVEYYAFNPCLGKLCRKRIKINNIKGTRARKQYATELMQRLVEKLQHGWNPFIASESSDDLKIFSECLDDFDKYNERMLAEGAFREQTYVGYKSYNKIFREFSQKESHKIYYLYQMDTRYLNSFLDDIFLNRGNSARTRNNYLTFLHVFCAYFKGRGLLKSNPAEEIPKISSRLIKKERELIPLDVVKKISFWADQHDKRLMLGCLMLFYCFIRPQEMCRLKRRNISFEKHTITIDADQSKNHSQQSVTMNTKVESYMLLLGIDKLDPDVHIFSKNLEPGKKEMNPVIFRHHWDSMRKELGFPSSYKFYSLKDTGITELADSNITNISIRDQARHSSLAITDIYTRHNSGTANHELENYEGSL